MPSPHPKGSIAVNATRNESAIAAARLISRRDTRRQVAMTFALAVVGAAVGLVSALGLQGL